jgi:hypothetical protein
MGMTYIIGKDLYTPGLLLSINVNSAADSCISGLLSFALEKRHPEIYDKITEKVIFMRFDELTKKEFFIVKQEIENIILRSDLSENLQLGAHCWLDLIKPIMDLDSRNRKSG